MSPAEPPATPTRRSCDSCGTIHEPSACALARRLAVTYARAEGAEKERDALADCIARNNERLGAPNGEAYNLTGAVTIVLAEVSDSKAENAALLERVRVLDGAVLDLTADHTPPCHCEGCEVRASLAGTPPAPAPPRNDALYPTARQRAGAATGVPITIFKEQEHHDSQQAPEGGQGGEPVESAGTPDELQRRASCALRPAPPPQPSGSSRTDEPTKEMLCYYCGGQGGIANLTAWRLCSPCGGTGKVPRQPEPNENPSAPGSGAEQGRR